MTTGFAELHDDLRAVARELLGAVATGGSPDWRLLADSGWVGLEVPEALDGAGATFSEVAVVLQEMGRAATRSPYLGSVVLAGGALAAVEPGADRDELLRGIASGATVAALALPADGLIGDDEPPFRVVRSGDGVSVRGQADFVPDATEADRLLLPAADDDGRPVVVAVDLRSAGIRVTAQPVLDDTRRLGSVVADGALVPDDSVWAFADDPAASLAQLHERAAVAIAIDSLGLAEAMLDATVAYASVRQQFGRPIGSFQAVKHACADMLVAVSVSRELVHAAVEAVAAPGPDAWVAASMAKAHACEMAVEVVGKALQLHGGIGYTWESGLHVYLKRATINRSLYGPPSAHRRRLATRHT